MACQVLHFGIFWNFFLNTSDPWLVQSIAVEPLDTEGQLCIFLFVCVLSRYILIVLCCIFKLYKQCCYISFISYFCTQHFSNYIIHSCSHIYLLSIASHCYLVLGGLYPLLGFFPSTQGWKLKLLPVLHDYQYP